LLNKVKITKRSKRA